MNAKKTKKKKRTSQHVMFFVEVNYRPHGGRKNRVVVERLRQNLLYRPITVCTYTRNTF